MKITKAELEDKFKVPVYVRWHNVPKHLHTRGWYELRGVKVPRKAEPDALKGGGGYSNHYNFLFDENNYLEKAEVEKLVAEREVLAVQNRPRLRRNYE